MANEKPTKPLNPLQLAGAVLLTIASIVIFIRRLPHHEFAAAHEDVAPRKRAKAAEDITFLAVPTQAAVSSALPIVPARPVRRFAAAAPEEVADNPSPFSVSADWTDDCTSEIGILCHAVPSNRLNSCLRGYEDALLKPCLRALNRRFPRKRSALEDEP